MRVAAIDIGTVTSRLLIADVEGSRVTPVVRRAEITNLGEGVDKSGVLLDAAIERTVAQVKEYYECIRSFDETDAPVASLVAVATSASRDAENSADFVAALQEIGVELRVIPGAREAQLSFLGAANDFRNKPLLVVDIGGGSTEVIGGATHDCEGSAMPDITLEYSHSFNVGCRRMTERFLSANPPTLENYTDARAWALSELAPFAQVCEGERSIVAVAGTATTAISIHKAMEVYDPERVHGAIMTREELRALFDRMAFMSLEEKQQVVGLQPQRASVIVAGFIILDVILELMGQHSFVVSESDILQGLVIEEAASCQ